MGMIGDFRRAISAVDPAALTSQDRIALLDLLRASYEAEVAPPPPSSWAASAG
jgi:hypothetical protein